MTIDLTVFGNAVPQGRPRFAIIKTRGGKSFGHAYDPKTSKDWKESVRQQAIINKVPFLTGALKMNIHFSLPRPQSLPKKVKHHVKRPDLSNFLKNIEDALRGIAYQDDSQICYLTCSKSYGEPPKVEIQIDQMDDLINALP
jgi:Holliday junction resolvase RusA-like endonuclease